MRGFERNRPALLAAVLLALLAAGCAGHAPATAMADPANEARRLRAECTRLTADAREACLEERLLALLEERGVQAAMGTLEQLAALDHDIQRDGHVYAHAIGIAAYTNAEEVGEVFASCTPEFQSGCYHGVIQAYFLDLAAPGAGGGAPAIDAAAVNALCADYRAAEGGRWLLFQCAHGMGHGLTMIHGYDLPRALEGCDLLEDDWERGACHGGAFMENVVNATMPHHPAARAEGGHGGHGGHAAAAPPGDEHAHHHGEPAAQPQDEHAHHGPSHGESTFRALDPEDPHHPCSALDRRYLSACYAMQTSAVLFHNRGDFAATAHFCDEAPEEVRHTCYQSLGRDINAYTHQRHAAAIEACAVGDSRYRSWCYVGVAKNLVDLTARAEDGLAFCRALPEGAAKGECYEAVGEQIWVLESEPARREALCLQAEPGHIDPCRYGAGLASREGGGAAR